MTRIDPKQNELKSRVSGSGHHRLDHTMRLIDWKENVWVACVIFVLEAIRFQVKWNVMDVRHIESDLVGKSGNKFVSMFHPNTHIIDYSDFLDSCCTHKIKSLLYGWTVDSFISWTSKGLH